MADKTKRVDGEDLTAQDFLIVGDPEDTSTWKLPWHFSTDEKTKSHLRNALARFSQLTDVSEEDKRKTWDKLKKLCDKYGIDVGDENNKGRRAAKQQLRMEIKQLEADGAFEGLLSVYGNVDQGRDLVEPGAFTKTIQEHGNEVPLLWQHDPANPIGKLTLQDGPDALRVKGQLLMELPEARKAYLLIKSRIVKGLSIGFDTIKDSIENGVRRLKELRLYEGSIVTFPMNESALITAVKQMGEDDSDLSDFNEELAERQLCDAGYQMFCALQEALRECSYAFYGGASKDEIVTMAQTICEQFSAAYMAYLPQYLDLVEEWYGIKGRRALELKHREIKEGRRHSAATKDVLMAACEHMMAAHKSLQALLDAEAGEDDTTSEEGAASTKATEPGRAHSAAAEILTNIRSLIPAAI